MDVSLAASVRGANGRSVEKAGAILYFGVVPFDSPRQRPQQLALQLARYAELIYVEPHQSSVRALLNDQRVAKAHAAPVGDGLRLFRGNRVLPFSGYLPLINRVNYAATAKAIREYLRHEKLSPPAALLVSFPKHVDVLRHFPGVPVVYDVMDDYPLFFDVWQRAVLRRLHRRLLQEATLVVASSRTLAERCRPHARRVECITNGVHADFLEACDRVAPDPAITALPRPRLGYVGTISWWFDFEVVRQLAEAFPDGSVIIVGPRDAPPPPLPPNVHLLGPRPHGQVPSILKAFDLGLIPFRASRLIDAVNPVKVYEYLAAGLPVASSAFAEIMPFAPVVSICRTPADWVDAARRALSESTSDEVAQRKEVAKGNLWSAKAERLLALLRCARD